MTTRKATPIRNMENDLQLKVDKIRAQLTEIEKELKNVRDFIQSSDSYLQNCLYAAIKNIENTRKELGTVVHIFGSSDIYSKFHLL